MFGIEWVFKKKITLRKDERNIDEALDVFEISNFSTISNKEFLKLDEDIYYDGVLNYEIKESNNYIEFGCGAVKIYKDNIPHFIKVFKLLKKLK